MAGLLDFGIAALGGLFGGDDDQQTQTSTNAPWAPAQPFMLRNLQDTEKLGNYYKQNPFNKQQIEGYSNLFGDIGNFRTNIAPGLMNFANQGMTGQYQRATGGRPGEGAGYGGPRQPGGRTGGLLGASTGPFSVSNNAGQSGGLLDLNVAQNPFANGGITQNPETVTEEMINELKGYLNETPGQDQDRGSVDPTASGRAGWDMPELPDFMSTLSPALAKAYADIRAAGIAKGMGLTYGDGNGYGGGYGGEGVQGPGGYGRGDGGYGPQ